MDINALAASALSSNMDVGVVGAGAMGAGIAQVAAVAGHRVRLFDTRTGAARSAIDGILAVLGKLVAKERMTQAQVDAVRVNLQPIEDPAALAGCGLIVEAIVEDLQAKKALFHSLEQIVGEDVILATNTSSLSVTAIGAGLRRPQRLAGLHFFNPAPLLPLVEIVSGMATSPNVASTLHATAGRWGKVPVHSRSTPGFIVNRVARPFYAEGLRLLNEGVADCATIDAIMRDTGGFRMGPFELMDLIGHDVNYAVTCSVFDSYYGDQRFTPSLLQRELVAAGFLGRKTGRGFYNYSEGAPPPEPVSFAATKAPTHVQVFGDDALVGVLREKVAASNIVIDRAKAHPDGRLANSEDFILYRTDGRTATQRAADEGVTNAVLVDLTLDPAQATRLALAVADQATEGTLAAAAGLLQAAGFKVSPIGDAPGMVVMRTVAMLANEGADAVNQNVCTASDCDLAMRKGVNYPLGPLEWADALGLNMVVKTLENLGAAYGEDRYRVSPLLRRKAIARSSFHGGSKKAEHASQKL